MDFDSATCQSLKLKFCLKFTRISICSLKNFVFQFSRHQVIYYQSCRLSYFCLSKLTKNGEKL